MAKTMWQSGEYPHRLTQCEPPPLENLLTTPLLYGEVIRQEYMLYVEWHHRSWQRSMQARSYEVKTMHFSPLTSSAGVSGLYAFRRFIILFSLVSICQWNSPVIPGAGACLGNMSKRRSFFFFFFFNSLQRHIQTILRYMTIWAAPLLLHYITLLNLLTEIELTLLLFF